MCGWSFFIACCYNLFFAAFIDKLALQCLFRINMLSVRPSVLSNCYKTCSMGYKLCIFVKNESKFVGN